MWLGCAVIMLAWGSLASETAGDEALYRGKTLRFLGGFAPGGGFDVTARVLARDLGRHIPGQPAIVVAGRFSSSEATSPGCADELGEAVSRCCAT